MTLLLTCNGKFSLILWLKLTWTLPWIYGICVVCTIPIILIECQFEHTILDTHIIIEVTSHKIGNICKGLSGCSGRVENWYGIVYVCATNSTLSGQIQSCDSDTVLIVNSIQGTNSVFRFIVQSVSYCHLQQHLYTLRFTIHQLDIDGTRMTVHHRRALPVDILMGSRESWKGNPVETIMSVLLTILFIPQAVAQFCCSCRINPIRLSKPTAL